VTEKINRARRAGLIKFSAIRDDGITRRTPHYWEDAGQLVKGLKIISWGQEDGKKLYDLVKTVVGDRQAKSKPIKRNAFSTSPVCHSTNPHLDCSDAHRVTVEPLPLHVCR
jgi:hypothetical protein